MIYRAIHQIWRRLADHAVVSNAVANVLVRGSNMALRLLVLFSMAGVMSPAAFGALSVAFAAVEIGRMLADFGVDALTMRFYAMNEDPKTLSKYTRVVWTTKVLMSSLVCISFLVFLSFEGVALDWATLIVLTALVPTGLWLNFSLAYFQGRLRTMAVLPVVLINQTFTALAFLVMLFFKVDMIWLLLLLPLSDAINALMLMTYLSREIPLQSLPSTLGPVVALLRESLPVALTNMLVAIYMRLDVIFIAAMLGATQVGYYSLAVRATEPFLLVGTSLAWSFYSNLSALLVAKPEAMAGALRRHAQMMGLYGVGVSLMVAVIAPIGIRWLLPEYSAAIPILLVLATALVFRTMNSFLMVSVQAYGAFAWVTGVSFGSVFLAGVLLIVLIPLYGAIGAAWALLAVEAISLIVLQALVRYLWRSSSVRLVEREVRV